MWHFPLYELELGSLFGRCRSSGPRIPVQTEATFPKNSISCVSGTFVRLPVREQCFGECVDVRTEGKKLVETWLLQFVTFSYQ